jgi:hypothetical protein
MKAKTPSMSRVPRRGTKFHSDGVPLAVPTFYFLQDASILSMDRLQ